MHRKTAISLALVGLLATASTAQAQSRMPMPVVPPQVEDVTPQTLPDPEKVVGMGASLAALPPSASVQAVLAGEGDPLPAKQLPDMNFEQMNLNEALKLALMTTGISFTVLNGAGGEDLKINITGLKGSLPEVMDELAEAGEFFYSYKAGTNGAPGRLRVTPTKHMTLKVPAVEDFMKTLPDVLGRKGAKSVSVDMSTSTVTFTATRTVARQVADYIDQQRRELVQIRYEISVYDVGLSDSSSRGLNFTALDFASAGGNNTLSVKSAVGAVAGALESAFAFKLGKWTVGGLFSFLQTQGDVQVVGTPQLLVTSGGTNTFEVKTTTPAISKITTTPGANGAANSTSVDLEKLETGVKIVVTGRYSEGVVYSDIKIDLSEVLSQSELKFGNQTLTQYKEAKRHFSNPLAQQPGESILLAGMLQRKVREDRRGPRTGVAFLDDYIFNQGSNSSVELSELVVVLRPIVERPGGMSLTGSK